MAQSYEKHYNKQTLCDGKKLRELILAKGMSLAEAGKAIGLSESGLRNPCSRNTISPHIIILVDKVLGIPFSEYEIKKPEPEPKKPESEKTEIKEVDKLTYKMIASATYGAIQTYCNKQLPDIIKKACAEALKDYIERR
jgi:transcriptional regulator with XRE-family HTH domain